MSAFSSTACNLKIQHYFFFLSEPDPVTGSLHIHTEMCASSMKEAAEA